MKRKSNWKGKQMIMKAIKGCLIETKESQVEMMKMLD